MGVAGITSILFNLVLYKVSAHSYIPPLLSSSCLFIVHDQCVHIPHPPLTLFCIRSGCVTRWGWCAHIVWVWCRVLSSTGSDLLVLHSDGDLSCAIQQFVSALPLLLRPQHSQCVHVGLLDRHLPVPACCGAVCVLVGVCAHQQLMRDGENGSSERRVTIAGRSLPRHITHRGWKVMSTFSWPPHSPLSVTGSSLGLWMTLRGPFP
jgi:hypothetical protein